MPKTLITESGISANSAELLTVGQLVSDRYKVVAVLGHGGMGAVYKVEQIFLRRMFALKTLHGQGFTEVAMRRFHKEAQAAGKLSHPNLVKAHDFGVLENHQPFFVMDLVEGQNLSEYSKNSGTLSIDEVLNIFIPVCFGMSYAHEQGVIHRDIKPGNIMLAIAPKEPSGYVPKVVDFGIAKMSDGDDGHSMTLTRTGEVFGTPLYMSPEQCMGVKVDHRSDIYSLGCVIYEALTGAPPFHGDTALNLMMKHQTAMPVSLKEASMGRDFPSVLEAIIAKTLIKDPDSRYQNFLDLALDLANLKQELSEKVSHQTVNRAHSQTVKDMPAFIAPTVKEQRAKTNRVALLSLSSAGCLIVGFLLGHLLWPQTIEKTVQVQSQPDLSDTAHKNYEESLSVGHTRYLSMEGSGTQPVQTYKFPNTFDIGIFKYTLPQAVTDNSSAARGSIAVPINADTYLKTFASILYNHPHVLRGFRSGDLHHLQIANDDMDKVEDLSFVFDTSLAHCADIKSLKEILLYETATTDRGISSIKDLPALESIDVSDTKVTAEGIQTLNNFGKLSILGVKNVVGAKSLIPKLQTNKKLQIVNFSNDDLTDNDMALFDKIPDLQVLSVNSNRKVTNEGISKVKNIVCLNIADTGVTPALADVLPTMKKLRAVTISKENWSAADVKKLVDRYPNLQVVTKKLDSNNRLTGWNWQQDL